MVMLKLSFPICADLTRYKISMETKYLTLIASSTRTEMSSKQDYRNVTHYMTLQTDFVLSQNNLYEAILFMNSERKSHMISWSAPEKCLFKLGMHLWSLC